MSAREPAVERLLGPLQRAVSCVSYAVLTGRRHPVDGPNVLTFPRAVDPVPLGGDPMLSLSVRASYRLAAERARPTVAIAGYAYELVDADGDRVVAYHWHPILGSPIDQPHLHLGRRFAHPGLPPALRAIAARLVRSHPPTGPVLLPTMLRWVIAELGVVPLRGDWAAVLDETEAALQALPIGR